MIIKKTSLLLSYKTVNLFKMRIFKALPIVLFVAFVGCKPNGNADATTSKSVTSIARDSSQQYSGIAYVNTDSLISKYKMASELTTTFNIKAEKSQKQFQLKQRAFQSKVADYQNKMNKGLVTRTEAMTIEEKLKGEEQSLMNYGRNMEATLQEEQGVLMNKVSFAVKEYITKFNNAKKYSLILNTNAMTSVVIAGDPALDITNEVVDGLNKEYAAEQAKTTK